MPTLLIVDDETALVRVLREAFELQLPDVVVRCAFDWDEAIAIVEGDGGPIDLLLTDQHLGAHTGTDLCAAAQARFPHVRMLIYTGKAEPGVEAAANALGARVLWKPQRLATLVSEIRAELDAAGPG
ncbi:MAG: response regulator [Alphaproteobacteria bacterium]|nr:response regulator [Alphaproteobacteria bacterium]